MGKTDRIPLGVIHNVKGVFSAFCRSCFAIYAIRRQNQQTLPPENEDPEYEFCYFFTGCSDTAASLYVAVMSAPETGAEAFNADTGAAAEPGAGATSADDSGTTSTDGSGAGAEAVVRVAERVRSRRTIVTTAISSSTQQ